MRIRRIWGLLSVLTITPASSFMWTEEQQKELRRYIQWNVKHTPGGCWEWLRSTNEEGYGRLRRVRPVKGLTANGKVTSKAHRVAYEVYVGAIADGLVLDHLCRNPLCCNPAHLEPVTQAENLRRGARPMRKKRPPSEYCRNGHKRTEENTYRTPRGEVQCLTCRRQYMKVANAKRSPKGFVVPEGLDYTPMSAAELKKRREYFAKRRGEKAREFAESA